MTRLDDDERALAHALGGPAASPRKCDEAFARSVASALRDRRQRPSGGFTWLWSGAAAAAALALFVTLSSSSSAPEADVPVSLAESSAEALDDELAPLDGYDDAPAVDVGELEDEELLALSAALEEALSL